MAPKSFVLCVTFVVLVFLTDHSAGFCGRMKNACSPPVLDKLSSLPSKVCYEPNEQITYSCEGHLSGPTTNQCNEFGEWVLPTPTCEGFTCDAPAVDESILITPVKSLYTAREEARFSCRHKYSILEGPSYANCERGGWNPNIRPFCLLRCHPPVIKFGSVLMDVPVKKGDTVKVMCDQGYIVQVGDTSRISCGDNGNWDHLPSCVSVTTANGHMNHV